jgi:quercetin dioxygenase-like cupin family protein
MSDVSITKYVVLGVGIEFLLAPSSSSHEQAVLRCELPGGTIVPLHRHQDMEIFYLLSGSMEFYTDVNGWKTLRAGEVMVIESNVKHALRNLSDETAVSVTVVHASLYHFFWELKLASDSPIPTPEESFKKLVEAVERYGYWLGSPDENTAIGLRLA